MIFPVKRVKEELINEFVELDIPHASKHQITVGIDRKELLTVMAGGIEIDIPITTLVGN